MIGNTIQGNSIHDNGGLGISLANGANNNQAAPVLTAGRQLPGTGTAISGTLAGTARHDFRIEFFSNHAPDPSGFGEGQTFLGFATARPRTPRATSLHQRWPRPCRRPAFPVGHGHRCRRQHLRVRRGHHRQGRADRDHQQLPHAGRQQPAAADRLRQRHALHRPIHLYHRLRRPSPSP